MKPINPFELQEAVNRAIRNFELRQNYVQNKEIYTQSLNNLQEYLQAKTGQVTKITIAEQTGFRLVEVADLMYLEGDDNYTVLHLANNQKITASRILGEFEKILLGPEFFRIHKSSIINMNFLVGYSSFQGNFALMKDGANLNISRRKLIEFREKVKNYSISID
jgi:two-component system LytT family response regulator